jgi:salicylate hydroxylase
MSKIGLWSALRQSIDSQAKPEETGDLAYRGTFSRQQLETLNDPKVHELIKDEKNQLWMGPGKHCSFYPLKNNTEFNLVLM